MADYPRILSADASRIAESAIRVRVQAEVSNASTNTLWETHEVAGDRLLVTIHQGHRPQDDEGLAHKIVAGRREIDIQIAEGGPRAASILYVDVYGGDYDHENARRVILPRRRPQ